MAHERRSGGRAKEFTELVLVGHSHVLPLPVERGSGSRPTSRLVGVPHSSGNGSTERDQHLGPRAVRNVSGFYRRTHVVHGFAPWDVARINDLGDVPLPEAMNNEACVRDIEAFYRRLDEAGTRPVSIGGDHSITGPILKAIAGPGRKLSGGKPCALIHFDAHTDSYDNMPHWLGAKRSAAHWAAYTAKEEAVDPHAACSSACAAIPRARSTRVAWAARAASSATGSSPWRSSRNSACARTRGADPRAGGRYAGLHHLRSRLHGPVGGARRLQHRARLLAASRSARRHGCCRA